MDETLLVHSAKYLDILLIISALESFNSHHFHSHCNFSNEQFALLDKLRNPETDRSISTRLFKKFFPQYDRHRKCCENFFSSTEFEDQALMITVHNDFKECVSSHSFNYATPITCEKNPQDVIELGFDTDEHYVLTPKTIITSCPNALWTNTNSICHKPKHLRYTRCWNLFQCWRNKFLESCFIHEALW